MKTLPLVLLLSSCVLSASAVEGKVVAQIVKNDAPVKAGQKISIAIDKGELIASPGRPAELSYRVEFIADKKGGWFDRSKGPTQKDFDECAATYTPEQGLKVRTGKGLNAVVTVGVPAEQALDVQLGAGVVKLGKLNGVLGASVGAGTLEYDASALPREACVGATVGAGAVENPRNCKPASVTLHVQTGTISVK